MSPLYEGYGAPGTDRATWLRALGQRREEAFHWYRHALAIDPASAAAACGLALAALDEGWTDDFVYFERGDGAEPEGLDDDDPAARAEAAGHLRRVLAADPGNDVAAHLLARLA
ncbi:hypothetical protein [Dactylosporangium sp. NPDC051541]|uniref:hypothetical protein n=1 Tax=Dactylosporangium sp. NPDC051541 TaxID=3363977 RepID=UPI0037BC6D34